MVVDPLRLKSSDGKCELAKAPGHSHPRNRPPRLGLDRTTGQQNLGLAQRFDAGDFWERINDQTSWSSCNSFDGHDACARAFEASPPCPSPAFDLLPAQLRTRPRVRQLRPLRRAAACQLQAGSRRLSRSGWPRASLPMTPVSIRADTEIRQQRGTIREIRR
jgi:hypothetical protein